MTDAAMAAPTRRVDVWFAGTAPQRRLTVAFRIILAIPQIFVLYFLFIAAFLVLVIGWFGALFMGRLPEWVHSFVSGVVRWTTRVGAYMYLLTDRYPPFSLDDEDYPARPILPEPGRLNRWAVLFRGILVIPAYVFAQIVEYGLSFPLLFVAWLIALFSGRMHPALYPAYSALLRYQVRLHSYLFMLTSEYAWGMLGDRSAAPSPFAPPPPASFPTPQAPGPTATAMPPLTPGSTPPAQPYAYPSTPTASTAGDASVPAEQAPEPPATDQPGPSEPHDAPAAPAPPQWPPPMPPPMSPPPPPTGLGAMPPPSPWERSVPSGPPSDETPSWATLVLTGAARGWMIFAIVWGSIVFVGQAVAQSVARSHPHTSARQVSTVVTDYNRSDTAIAAASKKSSSCATVACLRASHLDAASKLTQFDNDLRTMSLPTNASQPAQLVESDTTQLSSILSQLANSSDLSTYRATIRSSNLTTIWSSYHVDTQTLVNALNSDLG